MASDEERGGGEPFCLHQRFYFSMAPHSRGSLTARVQGFSAPPPLAQSTCAEHLWPTKREGEERGTQLSFAANCSAAKGCEGVDLFVLQLSLSHRVS